MRAIVFLLAVCFQSGMSAATFYMRADGSATKVNAIGPTSDSTKCMNVSTHNGATFTAGDTVLLSGLGGIYATTITVPSHSVTYANVPSETPVLTLLSMSGKTNLAFTGLTWSYTGVDANAQPISVAGNSAFIGFTNISITTVTGYCFAVSGTVTNLSVNGLTNTGAVKQGVYFYGATNGLVSLQNVRDDSGAGIRVNATAGLTLSNVTHLNGLSGNPGIYIYNCGGLLQATGLVSSNSASTGIKVELGNFTAGSFLTNCSVPKATSDDYLILNTGGLSLGSSTAALSGGESFKFQTSHDLLISGNTADSAASSHNCFYFTGCYNVTNVSNVASNSPTVGFSVLSGGSNYIFTSNIADGSTDVGFAIDGQTTNVVYTSCISRNGHNDGFSVKNGAHDVTYNQCCAHSNGDPATTANGDGFTCHDTNFNIIVNQCLSYSNSCSGYAFVGSSSGKILNSLAVRNGTATNQIRAGIYLSLSANNPTTGKGWFVTNCVSSQNFPSEVWLYSTNYSTLDYNCYQPTDLAKFASLDNGVSIISSTNYAMATREPHSFIGNVAFTSATDFHQLWTSAVIEKGIAAGFSTDYEGSPILNTPDIGPYEFQAKVRFVKIGSSIITIPQ